MLYKLALLIFLLNVCSCATRKPIVVQPVDNKLEIPELDASLVDPKVKVFQFIEDPQKEKLYICLTRLELQKLLYDLQSVKQSRQQDKLKMLNQANYYKEVTEKLNK